MLEKEKCWQRTLRLVSQFMRGIFMFAMLSIFPIVIIYVIIPKYGGNDQIVLPLIGGYLMFILCLQIFGTYRGIVSFYEKEKQKLLKLVCLLVFLFCVCVCVCLCGFAVFACVCLFLHV